MDNRKFIHEMCFSSWHGSWSTLLYSAGGCTGTRVHNGFAFITEGERKMFLPLMCSCSLLGVWPPFTNWRQVKVHHNRPGCKELWKFRKLSGWKSDPSHVGGSAQRSAVNDVSNAIYGIVTSCRWHHICGGWPWMGGVPKLKGYVVMFTLNITNACSPPTQCAYCHSSQYV